MRGVVQREPRGDLPEQTNPASTARILSAFNAWRRADDVEDGYHRRRQQCERSEIVRCMPECYTRGLHLERDLPLLAEAKRSGCCFQQVETRISSDPSR